jgi:hypothetical protein
VNNPFSEHKEIRFQRESLYQEVWAAPMRTVAKRYGISDVGLKKICIKLNIPLPGAGFWIKVEHGHKFTPPPLPSLMPGQPEEHLVTQQKPPIYIAPDSDAHRLILSEKNQEKTIEVTQRLTKPHPLVARTEAALKRRKPDDKGLVSPYEKGCLDVTVSPTLVNRALRILDTLIKTMETRGYKVSIKDDDWKHTTSVLILGEPVEFGLRERYRQQEKTILKNSWENKYQYLPSGLLMFSIKSWGVYDLQTNWSDGKTQRIEHNFGNILIGLITAAERLRKRRIEKIEEERRRNEERKRREERARLRQEELQKFQQLQREVKGYHDAEQIRSYVRAAKEMVIERDGEIKPGGTLEQWIIWALGHADRLDPLVESPPSVLDGPVDPYY